MSAQAQAAGHSIRSLIESMASGAPISQALGQQLGHLSFAASGGPLSLTGAFKQAGGAILGLLSPTTLIVTGLAALAAGTVYAISSVATLGKQFDDTSRAVGVTISQLHGLEAAASLKGIQTSDFLKAMEKFGADVYDAQHGMGVLAESFRASGQSAKTFTDYLGQVAERIKNSASEAQRLKLLQEAGLPANMAWVRLMSQGGDAIKRAADEANNFSNTAEGKLVASARKFDEEWNAAWKSWEDRAKSATLTVATWIDAAIAKAHQLGNDTYGGAAPTTRLTVNAVASSPTGPKVKTLAERQKEISDAQTYIGLLGQTATAEQAAQQVQLAADASYLSTGVGVGKAKLDLLKRLAIEQANGVSSIKASTDAARLDAATVGMSAGALAQYSAEQSALNAAKQRGTTLSEASLAQIHAEASALGQAAAQADLLKSAYTGLVQGPMQTFSQAIQAGASAMDALKKSGISALSALANKLMDMAAQNLWSAAFPGGSGGILGFLGIGGSSEASALAGGTAALHGGGIVGAESTFTKSVNPGVFNSAPRFHTGLLPNEFPAILQKGEGVFTKGQMAAMGGSGGAPIVVQSGDVHINIQGNADEKTVALLQQELAKRDAAFASNVVQTVKRAKQGRHL